MYGDNFRSPKVDVHEFAMIPRAEIPRSSMRMQQQHKTTIQATALVPFFLQEVLPGDAFSVSLTAFVRMATPIYPLMDNADLETWFFFIPNRLVWANWVRFMGEQDNPADSISFSIPQIVSPVGGWTLGSLGDYFGLPTAGQIPGGNTITTSVLPFRCYNLCWNQWFRDENLQNSQFMSTGDGPDANANYPIWFVNKRHDYFTSCLPWTQKGGAAITLPLGTSATVRTNAAELVTGAQNPMFLRGTATGASPPFAGTQAVGWTNVSPAPLTAITATGIAAGTGGNIYPTNLYADLSTATAATINQLRLAFQTQRLLERDARAGTRYTEIIRSHFGVVSPDMRLQRPEFLGGGRTPVNVSPVAQTTATGLTGGTSPLGTLSAVGTALARGHGFRQSFTEHGHILGLCAVRSDMGYQQGIRRLWKRTTRYDFYFPVFAALGEQSVFNYEIYSDGSANDALTFGYQERWAEYRYMPSYATGYFRSTVATPLDAWHLMQKFTALPTLSAAFMFDTTQVQVQRAVAAGAAAANQQFLCDFFFDIRAARPMPMYSVPGLIDHF